MRRRRPRLPTLAFALAVPSVGASVARAQVGAPVGPTVGTMASAPLRGAASIPPILRGSGRDAPIAAGKPLAAFSRSALSLRDSAVVMVRAQLGRRYVHGGTTPEHGFDCSGLVRYVMAALHIALPRTAREQARAGALVARDTTHLQPGDLLAFGFGSRVSHIGIYVGDGRYVHASSVAGRVIESPLSRPLVRRIKPLLGARRVLTAADSAAGGHATGAATGAASGADGTG
jgi:cell wall-associated NlpC family hydrolase